MLRGIPFFMVESGLDFLHVPGLETFRSLFNLELDHIALVQVAEAITRDRLVMDEYIFATRALDEAIALRGVKPLHSSFFHLGTP